jgi:F-type H+-transporting ATPase subunit c
VPREAATGCPQLSKVAFIRAGGVVQKLLFTLAFLAVGALVPLYAQEPGAIDLSTVAQWSIITAGFALGIAAAGGAIGQGRGVAGAVEAIARNPSAVGDIRGALILGLVLIESLVIYVLLISLILFFVKPFGG